MSPPPVVRSIAGLALACARSWWPQVVALAVASGVVTATVAGALGVGDAMHRGLLAVARSRLGKIEVALVSQEFFRVALGDDLQSRLAEGGQDDSSPALRAIPAIILEATVEVPADAGKAGTEARVLLLACDDLGGLGFSSPAPLPSGDGVAVNAPVAELLGLEAGDPVVVRMATRSAVPADSPLGRRTAESSRRRLRVSAVLPRGGLGEFSLRPTQVTDGLVVMPLATAHAILREEGLANTLLCVSEGAAVPFDGDALAGRIRRCLRPTLADLGLTLAAPRDEQGRGAALRLTSRRLLLDAEIDRAAAAVLGSIGGEPSLVFLATDMRPSGRTASVPYSTVVGLDTATHPTGGLLDERGQPLPLPGPDEIIIDRWMADDFSSQGSPVAIGDVIEVTTFEPETLHGRVQETRRPLRINGIASMQGAAVARDLVPEVEGITDEASIADWDPPFPFERSRVRTTPPHDEDDRYWKQHGAAPKAFVSLATARALAASRFGATTAWHVPRETAGDCVSLRAALAAAIHPERLGFRVVPVAAEATAAARGSVPFGGLFLGLSMFVVAAGLALEWLLFRLLVAAHAREVGLLAAVGWPSRRLAGLLSVVGGIAVVGGMVLGLLLAPAWSAALLWWLGRSWNAAVAAGSWQLFGAAAPRLTAMGPGAAAAAVISLAAVWIAARRAACRPPMPLLRGEAVAPVSNLTQRTTAVRSLPQLALRGLAHRRSRTLAVVAIVGLAEFVIVVVSAFALRPPPDAGERGSPTGGWTHIASFAVPNGIDPADPDVTATLGLDAGAQAMLAACTIERIRSNSGDDASCTNLYAATRPTVLGVGQSFVARGGFRFVTHANLPSGAGSPWVLLERDAAAGGPIPAILDQATAQWALRVGGVGSRFTISGDGTGPARELEVVGLLEPGILQGAVIVSERNFTRLEPRQSGYSMALVDASAVDPSSRAIVTRAIASAWAEAGVSVQRVDDRLRSLFAVQNTFLLGFQMLGSLGMLLGTLGVAAVQMQGVFERIGPFAVLRAIGFTLARVRRLILFETLFLVAAGLAVGAAAGCLALMPLIVAGRAAVPWAWLAASALSTVAASAAAGLIAARGSLIPIRPAGE